MLPKLTNMQYFFKVNVNPSPNTAQFKQPPYLKAHSVT